MRDNKRGIDLSAFDFLEERFKISMYVSLSHLERQSLIECRPHGNGIDKAAIHSCQGNSPAFAASLYDLTQYVRTICLDTHGLLGKIIRAFESGLVCLHTYRIDA